jgi:hypothetical protein
MHDGQLDDRLRPAVSKTVGALPLDLVIDLSREGKMPGSPTSGREVRGKG